MNSDKSDEELWDEEDEEEAGDLEFLAEIWDIDAQEELDESAAGYEDDEASS